MKFSTLANVEEFHISKNNFLEHFSFSGEEKLFLDISSRVELNLINKILSCRHILKGREDFEDIRYSHTLRKKGISKTLFEQNLFLFRIYHARIHSKGIGINNLTELGYQKIFSYSEDTERHMFSFIPKIELNYLTIDKYSYLYNFKKDKVVLREVKEKLKDIRFRKLLTERDKIFFDTFFDTRLQEKRNDETLKIRNDFILMSLLYPIYQEYLIMASILTTKKQEESAKILNEVLDTDLFPNDIEQSRLFEVISFRASTFFEQAYDEMYRHLNFSTISGFKGQLTESTLSERLRKLNLKNKKLLVEDYSQN